MMTTIAITYIIVKCQRCHFVFVWSCIVSSCGQYSMALSVVFIPLRSTEAIRWLLVYLSPLRQSQSSKKSGSVMSTLSREEKAARASAVVSARLLTDADFRRIERAQIAKQMDPLRKGGKRKAEEMVEEEERWVKSVGEEDVSQSCCDVEERWVKEGTGLWWGDDDQRGQLSYAERPEQDKEKKDGIYCVVTWCGRYRGELIIITWKEMNLIHSSGSVVNPWQWDWRAHMTGVIRAFLGNESFPVSF